MKQIIIAILFVLSFFGCNSNEPATPEKENIPLRMKIIEEHTAWGAKDWYILLDTKTGHEYLVCLTGSMDGGIAVIKLDAMLEARGK